MIVAQRARLIEEGWDHGARSIHARLSRAGVAVPSARTVHRVLVREGLIDPAPAKRPRSSFTRFEHPAPNSCWQLDGTIWHLADASSVCILRVIDDHSRLVLATRAAPAETTTEAWALIETAMARHGRPVMLLSDGGSAFTARRTTGGLSEFERRLREHGINPVVSSPAHPQTCGKKERDWQPLKRWLTAHHQPATLHELQAMLEAYDVLFNTERPHQALDGATPAERYHATSKATPAPGPLPPTHRHQRPTRPRQRLGPARQPLPDPAGPPMDRSHRHRGPRRPRRRDPPQRHPHQTPHHRPHPQDPTQRTTPRPTTTTTVRTVLTHVSDTSRHMTGEVSAREAAGSPEQCGEVRTRRRGRARSGSGHPSARGARGQRQEDAEAAPPGESTDERLPALLPDHDVAGRCAGLRSFSYLTLAVELEEDAEVGPREVDGRHHVVADASWTSTCGSREREVAGSSTR